MSRASWTQFKQFNLGQRSRAGLLAVGFVLTMLGSGFAGAWLQSRTDEDGLVSERSSGQAKIITSESRRISQIVKELGPSVVSVNVVIEAMPDPAERLFGLPGSPAQQGAGTGIIISANGLVITNRHVVPKEATDVSITLSDGTALKDVSVVGRTNDDDPLDIAFLKINDAEGHKLSPAVIGDSESLQVGDNVVAIGTALGEFQNTVTSGIISGFGRSVVASDSSGDVSSTETLVDLLQTDAAINEGNSGGPLVNLSGQVIGINTAIAGGAQNIGFAIPISNVKGIISQVLSTGKFARAYLGVHYIPLTPEAANQLSLRVREGAYITPSDDQFNDSVVEGSPAAKAGLKEKDIITHVNDKKVDQKHGLGSLLGVHRPGDRVTLTVLRGDKTLRLTVSLGTLPGS